MVYPSLPSNDQLFYYPEMGYGIAFNRKQRNKLLHQFAWARKLAKDSPR
jgi:hypothetical protein